MEAHEITSYPLIGCEILFIHHLRCTVLSLCNESIGTTDRQSEEQRCFKKILSKKNRSNLFYYTKLTNFFKNHLNKQQPEVLIKALALDPFYFDTLFL